jgi:hypothetical protein
MGEEALHIFVGRNIFQKAAQMVAMADVVDT